jgi:hypothetical protein
MENVAQKQQRESKKEAKAVFQKWWLTATNAGILRAKEATPVALAITAIVTAAAAAAAAVEEEAASSRKQQPSGRSTATTAAAVQALEDSSPEVVVR